MRIHSRLKDYEVRLLQDLSFLQDLTRIPDAEYVIDEKVYGLYREHFAAIPAERLFLLKAVEENKVLDTALAVCEKMTEISAKRNTRLVAVGGGIIQDIAGFAANVLYRGIPWTFVPTTLLSGCDSCIGGKTSLNYKTYKNLLGTFYPPDEVYICPLFFNTLSQRDFESGLGEVVKFNIMAGREGLKNIEESIGKLLERDAACLNRFIESSLTFKKSFIEADEFDRGERVKLNFAHTFGHAIETVTGYEIPHGTAVAIGMIMANRIAGRRGLTGSEILHRSEAVLLRIIHIGTDLGAYPVERFIDAMRKDKKRTGDQLTAVLMTDTGDLMIVRDLTAEEVGDAVSYFVNLYRAQ